MDTSQTKNLNKTENCCKIYEESFFANRTGSESESDREAVLADSGAVAGRTRSALKPLASKLWRKRPVESTLSDSESVRSSGSKRGRARIVSSDKAGKPVVRLSRTEFVRTDDERSEERESGKSGLEGDSSSEDERSADTLLSEGLKCAEAVKSIAMKSSNIKGDLRRDLKVAATAFKKITKVLSRRTSNQEVRRLQADNNRLRREMEDLRKEVTHMKEENERRSLKSCGEAPVSQQTSVPTELSLEEFQRAIMVSVGTMLNARLEGIEDRLLPAKTVRPPLGKKLVSTNAVAARVTEKTVLSSTQQKEKKNKSKDNKDVSKEKELPKETPGSSSTSWATVVRRGKRKASNQPAAVPPVPAAQKEKKKKKKIKKVRPPRSSAVVLTLQSGAEEAGHSYQSVIAEAKKAIGNLSELGIVGGVRCRKAATGARVLEILGAATGSQADALAGKIREVVPSEFVKVDRPVKCANLRVTGLDDSVSSGELIAAVATNGGCSEGQIKLGPIQTNFSGTGSARVTCPVAVANKLAASGRLLVGWSSARVVLLEARPMRCFRCLEAGHVGVKCTSTVDRSGECYRCGLQGHKATACSASPRCSLCAAEGKKADHRVGAKSCAYLKKRKTKKPPAAAGAQTAVTRREEVMIMEHN